MIFYKYFSVLLLIFTISACGNKNLHFEKNGATFYVDSVSSSISSAAVNENDLVNRKYINFTACVKDNAMNIALMGMKFSVAGGGVETEAKTTDERGCFMWRELFTYDPLDNEGFVSLDRTISAKEGHSGSEVVSLAFNPWKEKVLFLKRDIANLTQLVSLQHSTAPSTMSIQLATGETVNMKVDILVAMKGMRSQQQSHVTSLSLRFLKRDFSQYEISPTLGLTIAHQYRFKFNAAMVRRTPEGFKVDNIGMGNLKFYFVLLKDGYNPQNITQSDIISANEFVGTANLGQFIADVTLKFQNIAALASRMTGVLTVTSADGSSTYGENTFEGLVVPLASAGAQGIDLIPSRLNAKNIFQSAQNFSFQQATAKGIDLFAQHSGYVATSSNPVAWPLNRNKNENIDVVQLFKKKKQGLQLTPIEQSLFAKALCFKYFDGNNIPPAYEACLKEPNRMISAVSRDFVEKISNPTPRKIGLPETETLSMGTSFDFNLSQNSSKGNNKKTSVGWNVGLGGELGVGIPAGPAKFSASIGGKISTGQEWYTVSGTATSTTDATRVGVAKSISVVAEAFRFGFDATIRNCLLITPTQHLQSIIGASSAPSGKYICDEKLTQKSVEETYYFLNEARGTMGSPLSDNISSEDSPWRMFIRGKAAYSTFAQVFSQKNIKLVLQKLPEDQLFKKYNEFYVTQEFPGMLSQ